MSPQGCGGGKLMPNLDQSSAKVLNLTVLQRIDPFVEEILITAAHVTLYEFNIDLNQWSRKDVEGSLFVVKRNTQPRFQLVVMNRRNTENLIEDLLGDFEYEVQVPYLLYRNAAQEVNGIWFYNSHECEAVANLFNRILNAFSKVPPKHNVSSSKSEFEELEAVPSSSVIEGPLEPSTSATTVPDVSDNPFVNFFNATMNIGNMSNALVSGPPHNTSTLGSLSSQAPIVAPSAPTLRPSLPSSATPIASIFDAAELGSNTTVSHTANLVKPSFFNPPSSGLIMPPITSSMPATPPLHPSVTLQHPYGMPLLQSFPPPAPSPSLTPATNYGPVITRDRVRDALLTLVQKNDFIDMVYREMLNSHTS